MELCHVLTCDPHAQLLIWHQVKCVHMECQVWGGPEGLLEQRTVDIQMWRTASAALSLEQATLCDQSQGPESTNMAQAFAT